MKLLSILISAFVCLVSAEYKSTNQDKTFHYGNLICGKCRSRNNPDQNAQCIDNAAGSNPGGCLYGCIKGWEGMMKDKGIGNEKSSLCDQPICAEGLCGPYGTCVAPNNCACPKLYSRDPATGGCYSLRVDGLKGAAAAFAVLIFSITSCHIAQTVATRNTGGVFKE